MGLALGAGIATVAVPWGELFIGALTVLVFSVGNWSLFHGYINGDFAYLLVFLAVAAFSAGHILTLDRYIEAYEIDGEALVERYLAIDYILGYPCRAILQHETGLRPLGTCSLTPLVVGALAVSIFAGLRLTHAVLPTTDGILYCGSGHLTVMDTVSMPLGMLW